MTAQIKILLDQIPGFRTAAVEQIYKGYSNDDKYIVARTDGSKALLRTSDIGEFERKKAEFQAIKQLQPYGIRIPEALELGRADEQGLCYMLLSYIEGEDASEALPKLSEAKQYAAGKEAGSDLAAMHRFPAPAEVAPWHERWIPKYRRYTEAYQTCGVRLSGAESIIAFVDSHLNEVWNRPNQFQHDDFHVGNLIVRGDGYAGAIDFNRMDWGDPIHDFYKLAYFTTEVSMAFAAGQIDGYFEGRVIPGEFWTLYAVYNAMNVFSSIVWTSRVVPDQLPEMLERVERVIDEHAGFERLKPKWYQ